MKSPGIFCSKKAEAHQRIAFGSGFVLTSNSEVIRDDELLTTPY